MTSTVEIFRYVEGHPELLIGKTRHQTYGRYYLFGILRDRGITYAKIGRLFGKNHSTVIHGTRIHDNFTEMGDQLYRELTSQLRAQFEPQTEPPNLVNDVLNCKGLRGLGIIQARLRGGYYAPVSDRVSLPGLYS